MASPKAKLHGPLAHEFAWMTEEDMDRIFGTAEERRAWREHKQRNRCVAKESAFRTAWAGNWVAMHHGSVVAAHPVFGIARQRALEQGYEWDWITMVDVPAGPLQP